MRLSYYDDNHHVGNGMTWGELNNKIKDYCKLKRAGVSIIRDDAYLHYLTCLRDGLIYNAKRKERRNWWLVFICVIVVITVQQLS